MALMSARSWDDWIREYAESHQNPKNRLCHTIGIPMIVLSLPVLAASLWVRPAWAVAFLLFGMGWLFQFAGHFCERKPPEFFRDWRFLFVGVRWWLAKMRGGA